MQARRVVANGRGAATSRKHLTAGLSKVTLGLVPNVGTDRRKGDSLAEDLYVSEYDKQELPKLCRRVLSDMEGVARDTKRGARNGRVRG